MKHILVPTDFSENALHALRVAKSLALAQGARITLLHAYPEFQSPFQPESANTRDNARLREEALANMSTLMEKLQQSGLDAALVETKISAGILPDVICSTHERQAVDLVVMGTAGASGVTYHTLGSNTLEVAKEIRIPLLIVPSDLGSLDFRNISLYTDFQPGDRHTLAAIHRIFGADSVDTKLVHILEKDEQMDTIQTKLERWAEELQTVTGVSRLEPVILTGSSRREAGIVAVTMVEKSFWDRLLDKSMAKSIILEAKTPVFIAN